jgi:hypothetical protein
VQVAAAERELRTKEGDAAAASAAAAAATAAAEAKVAEAQVSVAEATAALDAEMQARADAETELAELQVIAHYHSPLASPSETTNPNPRWKVSLALSAAAAGSSASFCYFTQDTWEGCIITAILTTLVLPQRERLGKDSLTKVIGPLCPCRRSSRNTCLVFSESCANRAHQTNWFGSTPGRRPVCTPAEKQVSRGWRPSDKGAPTEREWAPCG